MVIKKFLGISTLLLSLNATASEAVFPVHGEAKSKYQDYELIKDAAKGRAIESAALQCPNGAVQESDWEIRRWSSWDLVRPCSPYEVCEDVPRRIMYSARATASFVCR